MKRVLISIVVIMAMVPAFAHAFDDYRQGFIAGLGLGKHESDVTNTDNLLGSSEVQSVDGSSLSLRLGAGVVDSVLVYWFMDLSRHEESNVITGTNHDMLVGYSGLGLSVYFTPRSTSLYFNGAVGVAAAVDPAKQTRSNLYEYQGTGHTLGVGLELGAGMSIELNRTTIIMEHKDNDGTFVDQNKDLETTRISFVYTWY
ncbi:MAG: hypothetical protein OEZ68_00845 [Gammaproteobacteria bacterium]|nr:hypothetical protein [Gammaproteobacteria bacterium]MDH5799326.1 hypothetical protein [Gammaproteobacteria bacterium]